MVDISAGFPSDVLVIISDTQQSGRPETISIPRDHFTRVWIAVSVGIDLKEIGTLGTVDDRVPGRTRCVGLEGRIQGLVQGDDLIGDPF